ncbi:branched-chain amino acid--2-keto-4-methylthiobutyrate aminotransferase [Jannaschia sp. CCS1]|uniref:branched-chain amino acid--2-keto-4-methylthiobutyrate aminotransferase n=1 Tax=Jannaschia sp. (strain CCS1) TaxID=290400 RepID=UPI000053AC0C|nr:branched-chain amino acid--2-keto-4-methylthiobutyrate aminotransferase [Jannaschia sp. CCS1]ABD54039.1 branched chain amino acid: 2-keto-4-methylthiobutyrate aminotransferase [Jannaschia sp. CCS1]
MNDLSNGAAWMGSRIIPIAEAAIPVTDWGLTHSDIAYDVVPVWRGGFFRLDDYVARFMASVGALRMDIGRDGDGVKTALTRMVAASGLRDSYVAMVAARGRNPVPGSRDPRDCANHFYAWCVPYVHIVKPEIAERGTSVWIAKRTRRIPADSVDPTVKNYHWGDFTGGLFEAKDKGFETVLLLDHAGHVTEGPGFNAFALFGDRIVTSDHGVLHGITRRTVLEMAAEAGLTVETRPLPLDEFLEADEVFLSSSGGGVIPVARVDNRVFSNDAAGPVALDLRRRYFDWITRAEHRTDIAY